jgi:OFA family oxalate/formate antiporter-like MFS transporter
MSHLKTRWGRLALGVITLFFAGIIYAWSIINAPFVEGNRLGDGICSLCSSIHFSQTILNLNFTITMCFFCISGFVSGLLDKKISPRIRLIASALLLIGGFTITSSIPGWSQTGDTDAMLMLFLGYGVMAGTGIGIVYNVVISKTNAWFPDKAGISSGALMMGFGFTALVLGNIMSKLFYIESIGWRKTYLGFGIIIGIIIFIASFFIKAPSPDLEFPKSKKASGESVKDYTTAEMAKTFTFWKLFMFFILLAAVGNTAIAGAKGQFVSLGLVEQASILASLVTICNGVGRIVSGAFFDAFGLRKTQYLTSAVVLLATTLTCIGYAFDISISGIIGLLLCGFSYGFCPTASSAFVGAIFGKKHFGLNFSTLNLILIPASFVPTLFSSFDPTLKFGLLIAFSVLGLIINLSIKPQKIKDKKDQQDGQ